tara:strand:- start:20583 stop:20879 length:297 start_codon:yes stop_codon:yes gene_type:complete
MSEKPTDITNPEKFSELGATGEKIKRLELQELASGVPLFNDYVGAKSPATLAREQAENPDPRLNLCWVDRNYFRCQLSGQISDMGRCKRCARMRKAGE